MVQQLLMGRGLIIAASRSLSDTPHSGRVISLKQIRLLNTQHPDRQTSMSPAGFERAIAASELPQTYALDRAATGNCERLLL
jgi:hypothetical protein